MTPDLQAFVERLRQGPSGFVSGRPVRLARAPGRLDAFGGVIDYTGGTVCELPLAMATRVALQRRDDRRLVIHSPAGAEHGLQPTVEVDLSQLVPTSGPRPYAEVCAELQAEPAAAWVGYVAGAWLVLATEGLVDGYPYGAEVMVDSDVPFGAGVSSSAALEIATLSALAAELALTLEPKRLARLGQIVENHVVGAPCGLMDQLTVTLGEADALLVIRCQPDEILGQSPLPDGVRLAAIHTGVKHAVGGSHYTDARIAAFMGHRIILEHLRELGTAGPDEDPFGGYLARVPAVEYRAAYQSLLPARMTGAEFLRRYSGTVDTATTVAPGATYQVASAVRHQVLDNDRAGQFVQALDSYQRTRQPALLEQAGELLLTAHAGYGDDLDLGAAEADLLLELAMRRGPRQGIYGGRITGGGCGGSVALLGDQRLPALLPILATEYARESGQAPTVIQGSSNGAAATGVATLSW